MWPGAYTPRHPAQRGNFNVECDCLKPNYTFLFSENPCQNREDENVTLITYSLRSISN